MINYLDMALKVVLFISVTSGPLRDWPRNTETRSLNVEKMMKDTVSNSR